MTITEKLIYKKAVMDFFKTVKYKPGTYFAVNIVIPSGLVIDMVTYGVPDSDVPDKKTDGKLTGLCTLPWALLPELNSPDFIKFWTRQAKRIVMRKEFHEVQEWLRVDGKRILEPSNHPEAG